MGDMARIDQEIHKHLTDAIELIGQVVNQTKGYLLSTSELKQIRKEGSPAQYTRAKALRRLANSGGTYMTNLTFYRKMWGEHMGIAIHYLDEGR